MHEKNNVIESGRTPSTSTGKTAAELEDHVTKRAADEVADQMERLDQLDRLDRLESTRQ